jgi:hypothetical protein
MIPNELGKYRGIGFGCWITVSTPYKTLSRIFFKRRRMTVEGLIDKEYVPLIEKAGYIFEWIIEDREQLKCAKEKGLPVPDEFDESKYSYIRVFIDNDIESFFPLRTTRLNRTGLLDNIEVKDLPLLLNSKNEEIINGVSKILKKSRKET